MSLRPFRETSVYGDEGRRIGRPGGGSDDDTICRRPAMTGLGRRSQDPPARRRPAPAAARPSRAACCEPAAKAACCGDRTPKAADAGSRLAASGAGAGRHGHRDALARVPRAAPGFVARRVSNPADVDDIVQRVFLQMHRSLGRIRAGERIHAWLYSTARRAIVDYYRAGTRRREVPAGDAADLEALQARAIGERRTATGARRSPPASRPWWRGSPRPTARRSP